MKIIPDMKATFGETHFLGYTIKKKYDAESNKKTDEIEAYVCKIVSSELQEQIEVTVPPTVDVTDLKFNQKVTLIRVTIDPWARSTVGTTYAQVFYRCTAENILDEAKGKSALERVNEQK